MASAPTVLQVSTYSRYPAKSGKIIPSSHEMLNFIVTDEEVNASGAVHTSARPL
jgi:hypothetical protein